MPECLSRWQIAEFGLFHHYFAFPFAFLDKVRHKPGMSNDLTCGNRRERLITPNELCLTIARVGRSMTAVGGTARYVRLVEYGARLHILDLLSDADL